MGYLESCESGSMFEDMSIPGVYALSASNPTESSWGSYCGSEAKVNGKSINSCLGDLFSVNWMEEADASDMTAESLEDNFGIVKTKTDRSADRLKIGQELQQELNAQLAVDMIHSKFLSLVYPGDDAKQEAMRTDKVKPALRDCEVRVHNAFMDYAAEHFDANTGFALQFHQVVVNVCADQAQANGPISNLEGAVKDACAEGIVV